MTRSRRTINDVLASLRTHPQLTVLMMLGPAVGVAVLSAVIVIGQGTEARIMGLVQKHGLDMIMVRAGGEVQVFAPKADRGLAVLVEADARAIEAEIPGVTMVSAVQNQRGITVVYGRSLGDDSRASASSRTGWRFAAWGIAEGEFISETDMAGMARVVMLGRQSGAGALSRRRRRRAARFASATIRTSSKAVFIEMGVDAGGDDWDDRIVVPFTTSSRRLFDRPYLEQIVIRVDDPRRVADVAERVRHLLRVRHSIAPGEPDDFFVREPEDVENAAVEMSSSLSSTVARARRRRSSVRRRRHYESDARGRIAARTGDRPAPGDGRAIVGHRAPVPARGACSSRSPVGSSASIAGVSARSGSSRRTGEQPRHVGAVRGVARSLRR